MPELQNENLTFEKVWAALMENREQIKETTQIFKEIAKREEEQQLKRQEEFDKQQAKYQAEQAKYQAEQAKYQAEQAKRQEEFDKQYAKRKEEFDRQSKESAERHEKLERQMKMTNEQMGLLNNRFGELAEHLVAPSIHDRFNELGYHFDAVAPGGFIVRDDQGKIKTEIDLLLENGETIMIVEIKSKPTLKDIEHHIKRLEILRAHKDKVRDKRKIQGAIAGAIFGVPEKKATLENGFYVIEQSGDTVKIEIPEGFIPREY